MPQADSYACCRLDQLLGTLENAVAEHGLHGVPTVELNSIRTVQQAAHRRFSEALGSLQCLLDGYQYQDEWPLTLSQFASMPGWPERHEVSSPVQRSLQSAHR